MFFFFFFVNFSLHRTSSHVFLSSYNFDVAKIDFIACFLLYLPAYDKVLSMEEQKTMSKHLF